jgi:hypothetical protein
MTIKKAKVRLAGEDGNAWAIMGRVSAGLRRAGNTKEVIDAYTKDAMAGDYNHLLRVSMDHVDDSYDDDAYYEDDEDE